MCDFFIFLVGVFLCLRIGGYDCRFEHHFSVLLFSEVLEFQDEAVLIEGLLHPFHDCVLEKVEILFFYLIYFVHDLLDGEGVGSVAIQVEFELFGSDVGVVVLNLELFAEFYVQGLGLFADVVHSLFD